MLDWLPRRQPQQALAIFGIVLALSAWVIVPLAVSDGSDGLRAEIRGIQRTPAMPATPAPPPPPPTVEPTPRPPADRSVGETAADDGLRLTVTSIREVSRIERETYYKTPFRPPRGGTLIAAKVTYVNETKEPLDPFCGSGSAALVDQKGRSHETVDALYSIEGNDAVCGGAATPPGNTSTVTLAFKLRRGTHFSHLDLWNGKYAPDFDGEASRVRFRRR